MNVNFKEYRLYVQCKAKNNYKTHATLPDSVYMYILKLYRL